MKELPYFRFYPAEWKAGKISAFGALEQGIFLNLCIIAWQKGGEIDFNSLLFAKQMEVSEVQLNTIVEQLKGCGILLITSEGHRIKFIEEQLSSSAKISRIRKKAVENRYKNQPQKVTIDNNSTTIVENVSTKSQEKEKDKEKEKEEDKDSIPHTPKKEKVKKFIPPTFEEFEKYCKENLKEYELDPKRIYMGYAESNWIDSQGTPIKNWKTKTLHVWCKIKKDNFIDNDESKCTPKHIQEALARQFNTEDLLK